MSPSTLHYHVPKADPCIIIAFDHVTIGFFFKPENYRKVQDTTQFIKEFQYMVFSFGQHLLQFLPK